MLTLPLTVPEWLRTASRPESSSSSAKNADKLVAVMNQYPGAVFLWGHNHTEQDPNYGMIRLPGDIIQTSASAITFSYADGTLTVESTGVAAGPGGPPPASTASTLYLSGEHFNYSVMAASSVELYRVDLNFTDLDAKAYYYDAARWSVLRGIINGASDTEFDPDGTCTRAQAVTMIWRAAGCPAPETKTNPFTDVKEGAYAAGRPYSRIFTSARNRVLCPHRNNCRLRRATFPQRKVLEKIRNNSLFFASTWIEPYFERGERL